MAQTEAGVQIRIGEIAVRIEGKHVAAGATVTVPASVARRLVAAQRAERIGTDEETAESPAAKSREVAAGKRRAEG